MILIFDLVDRLFNITLSDIKKFISTIDEDFSLFLIITIPFLIIVFFIIILNNTIT
jgi:hypothetical protein